jgi:hypothetical protein
MILFALSANASIAALFVAGIVPGLLMCAGFMGVCWWVGRRRGFPRDTTPFAWPAFRRHLLYASPALLLPVLIIVFLRFGIATPTEVAVLSTLYAGLVSAVVYRDLGWRRLNDAVVHAGLATGVVLLVIMASAAIGWLLTFDRMPDGIVQWVQSHVHSAWLVIVLMNLLMLFIGMFIDLPAAVLLLTPVFVPLAQSIGMDMTQLGIMMVVNLALGLYTPPVGTTLFITSSLARVKVGQTVRELIPFYLGRWPCWRWCPMCRPASCAEPRHSIPRRRCMNQELQQPGPARACAYRIRRRALRMGEVQGQGYIGQALGWADVLAVAYGHAAAAARRARMGAAATASCSRTATTPSPSTPR